MQRHTTINRAALSPSLQEGLEAFDVQAAAYLALQKQRTDIFQETARLEQAGAALDAEAVTVEAECRALAQDHKADQRKINTEFERVLKLKAEAGKFRDTASWRLELHTTITIDIARARLELVSKAAGLNALYRAERLEALLATEGLGEALRDVLGELYDLHCIDGTSAEFGGRLVKLIEQARDGNARALVAAAVLPRPQDGEAVAESSIGLKKLIETGGKVPVQQGAFVTLRTA